MNFSNSTINYETFDRLTLITLRKGTAVFSFLEYEQLVFIKLLKVNFWTLTLE